MSFNVFLYLTQNVLLKCHLISFKPKSCREMEFGMQELNKPRSVESYILTFT